MAAALFDHELVGMKSAVQQAVQIDVKHFAPMVHGKVMHFTQYGDPGVVK